LWIKKNPFRNCEPEDIKIEDNFVRETSDS
jgi:hypothetical protein